MTKGGLIKLLAFAFLVTLLFMLFDGNKTEWLLSLIVIELGTLICKDEIKVNLTQVLRNKTGKELVLEPEEEQQ